MNLQVYLIYNTREEPYLDLITHFEVPVQIVRPGGMERPTDAFKETHNITLSTEDTLFGGLVSNLQVFIVFFIVIFHIASLKPFLQTMLTALVSINRLKVAELMACMAKKRSLSYCKVVEVVAETTAPLRPMEELLAKIPSQRAPPKVILFLLFLSYRAERTLPSP